MSEKKTAKKKRSVTYRKAAKRIWEYYGIPYGCCAAIMYVDDLSFFFEVEEESYPELYLFKEINYSGYWWPDYDRGSRIIALLLCEVIAKENGN